MYREKAYSIYCTVDHNPAGEISCLDVDYRANKNILHEALIDNVRKFMYISVLNANKLQHLEIVKAKERFVQELKQADIEHIVIRPNGFFSDMTEFFTMAKKGKIYLFGDGHLRTNPIHGKDLAVVCLDAIESLDREINVGGPETLTHNEIAMTVFEVLGIEQKITYIPDWIRASILKLMKIFPGSKTYGPIEFFLTVMAMDMIAPEHGNHTLRKYFSDLRDMNA